MNEDTTERDSGRGQGRNVVCGNGRGRETLQITFENDRQGGDWSVPNSYGWGEMKQDRNFKSPLLLCILIFSDWSSLGSPLARTLPHGVSDREVEQNVNIPNQLNVQSGTVPREETIRC